MRRPDLETLAGLTLTGVLAGAVLMASVAACALIGSRRHEATPPPPEPVAAGGTATRPLELPVAGVSFAAVRDSFLENRERHVHRAVDILAPRGSPVRAADAGFVARLPRAGDGGIAVEQLTDDGRLCFYYAHLQGYAPGVQVGQRLARGEVIGFVGTTGNAPKGTPHLHFAIFELGADKRCFSGTPVDPYPLLRQGAGAATGAERHPSP